MTNFSIKRVEIQNFRSIEDVVSLDFKPGLYTIEGVNNDEKATNGAGKSTILSAVYWCITGSALTNEVLADEVVNDKAGKNCKVVLYIDSDQGEIKITRTRKDSELGNTLLLDINGNDLSCHKIVETQERLNQLIKIPFDLLHSTIMMTHDIKSAFSELSPQQRIQTLESIRDYSIWDKVRDEANKDIKIYNSSIKENELEISKIDGSNSAYKRIIEENTISLNNLKNNYNIEAINANINKMSSENSNYQQQIIKETKELKAIQEKLGSSQENNGEKLTKIVDEANKIKSEIKDLEYDIKNIDREVDVIEKWFINDKCPTCGKPLDRTEEEKSIKNSQKNDFMSKRGKIESIIKEKEEILSFKRKEWSEINSLVQNEKGFQENLMKIQSNLTKLQSLINENDKKIITLKSEMTSFNEKVAKYEEQIEKTEKLIKESDIKRVELINNNKLLEKKRQFSDYYYRLLGSKGELRPYLLNKDIQTLNEYMQKYIHLFFKNTEVSLKLNGSAIDINIDSLGIKKTVSRLSGGEKKRLDLAIQFALYDLLKSTSQIKFNLVCFDEIESELDDMGIQQIIELVEDKSEDIESVFWITNNSMVSDSIPHKILCTKSLGKTTIKEI